MNAIQPRKVYRDVETNMFLKPVWIAWTVMARKEDFLCFEEVSFRVLGTGGYKVIRTSELSVPQPRVERLLADFRAKLAEFSTPEHHDTEAQPSQASLEGISDSQLSFPFPSQAE